MGRPIYTPALPPRYVQRLASPRPSNKNPSYGSQILHPTYLGLVTSLAKICPSDSYKIRRGGRCPRCVPSRLWL